MSERAPEKPKENEPCNGCGFCCAAIRCPLALIMIGDGPAPCPAMEFDGGRFWCGLLRDASRYSDHCPPYAAPFFREQLLPYFGTGCDTSD